MKAIIISILLLCVIPVTQAKPRPDKAEKKKHKKHVALKAVLVFSYVAGFMFAYSITEESFIKK